MPKLSVFNSVSLDGYFTDASGDMGWAHHGGGDAEFEAFTRDNAKGGGMLAFGRITYEIMAGFWPTPAAAEMMPAVAAQMNALPKLVFSRSMKCAEWSNSRVVDGDATEAMRRIKQQGGPDIVILGSGSIVAQFAEAGLIDEYQMVFVPVVLGGGRTMFDGVSMRPTLSLMEERAFANGKVFMRYRAA